MNLYLLTRRDEPDWDEHVGFVVAAVDPQAARAVAWTATSDESRYREGRWLDPKQTKCETLKAGNRERVVLESVLHG